MGVAIIRIFGEAIFTNGDLTTILVYILSIPSVIPFALLIKKILNISYSELLKVFVVISFSAIFFDGIALAWFTSIYHPSYEIAAKGAGFVFWVGSWGLSTPYILEVLSSKGIIKEKSKIIES
jgi:hypothetical protein